VYSQPEGLTADVLALGFSVVVSSVDAFNHPIAAREYHATGSHPEMVGDMSRVTLNFDLLKIPFVRF